MTLDLKAIRERSTCSTTVRIDEYLTAIIEQAHSDRAQLLALVDRMREALGELSNRAAAETRNHPGRGHAAGCKCQLCASLAHARELLEEVGDEGAQVPDL